MSAQTLSRSSSSSPPASATQGSQECAAPCPATDNADTKSGKMPPHGVGIQMLGDQARALFGTRDLLQPECLSIHLVLKPKIANVEVAQLAKSYTWDNADCSAGVNVHRGVNLEAKGL